jgi:hypothetical protein
MCFYKQVVFRGFSMGFIAYKIKHYVCGLLFSLAVSILTYHFYPRAIHSGLDGSWWWALNYFVLHPEFKFGRDIFFTYGPLGFLRVGSALGHNLEVTVWFWFVLRCVGVASAYCVWLRLYADRPLWHRLLGLLLIFAMFACIDNRHYSLFIYPLLFLLNHYLSRRFVWIVMALLVLVFSLQSEFGIALPAVVVCGVYLMWGAYGFTCRGMAKILGVVCLGVGLYVVMWLCVTHSFIGLWGYLKYSVVIVLHNSNAMSLVRENNWLYVWLGLVCLLVVGFCVRTSHVKYDAKSLNVFLWILVLPTYAWFKYSFGRESISHVTAMWSYFLVILLWLLFVFPRKQVLLGVPVAGALLLLCGYRFSPGVYGDASNYYRPLWYNVHEPVFSGKRFIRAVWHFDATKQALISKSHKAMQAGLPPMMLKPKIRRMIGDQTVDFYPWELTYVYANHLNWLPRPLFQSYIAYSPALDRLNAVHVEKAGPEFFMWGMLNAQTVNGDNSFNSAPLLMYQWLNWYRYKALDTRTNLFVFKRRKQPYLASPRFMFAQHKKLGVWVKVPHTKALIERARIRLHKNIFGTFQAMVYKLMPVYIQYKLDNGQTVQYRLLVSNAVNGVWLKPYLSNAGSMINSGVLGNRPDPQHPNILAFRILPQSGLKSLYGVQFYKIQKRGI